MNRHLYFDSNCVSEHNGLFIEHTVALGDKTLHRCPYYMLVYAAHGSGRYFIDDTDRDFAEGDILLINPNVEHCVHSILGQRGMSVYCCSFFSDVLPVALDEFIKDFPELSPFLSGEAGVLHVHDTPQNDVLSLMIKMMDNYTYMPPAYELAVMLQLMEALINVMRLSSDGTTSKSFNTNTIIGNVMDYVQQHYKERILLDYVANRMHISVQHLCRLFKKHTNMTFSEYVNRVRVERIKQELAYTDRPMYIIYEDFDLTAKHLNRIFKQYTGFTMQEYKDKFNYKSNNPLYKWKYYRAGTEKLT